MQYPYGHSHHHGPAARRMRAAKHLACTVPQMPPMTRVGKPVIVPPTA